MSSPNSPSAIEEIANVASSVPDNSEKLQGTPFVVNTYQLVSDPTNTAYVRWSEPNKDSFIILNVMEFTGQVLSKYFKHSNFNSFLRQLNAYGFHKTDSKVWEFRHSHFKAGQPHLLKLIVRKKSKKTGSGHDKDEMEAPLTKRDSVSQISTYPSAESRSNASANALLTALGNNPSALHLLQQASIPSTPATPSTPLPLAQSNDLPPFLELAQMIQKDGTVNIAKPSLQQQQSELDRLKEMNSLIIRSIGFLQQQQKTTQETMVQILDELVRSRREQQTLQRVMEDVVKRKGSPNDAQGPSPKVARVNPSSPPPAQMMAQYVIPPHLQPIPTHVVEKDSRIEEESHLLTQLQMGK